MSEIVTYGHATHNPPRIRGCTISTAVNYNPLAVINDGSCVFLPAPVYGCTNPDASNYNPNATINDGSCTFSNTDVTFDTAGKKTIATKIGANIFQIQDVSHLVSWTSAAAALGLQAYYLTPSPTINAGQGATINTFLTNVSAEKFVVYYPIQSNPITAAFPSWYNSMNSLYNIDVWQLDQESQGGAGLSNATYISRSQQVIAYDPTMQFSWDTAQIWKGSAVSINRNLAIAPQTTPTWGRQYEQLCPDRVVWSDTDNDYNLTLINFYYGTLLPTDITNYLSFPQYLMMGGYNYIWVLDKMNVLQWHNSDAGAPVLSAALANFSNGEMARVTLANTEVFSYLFYMKLGNLISNAGAAQNEYESVKLIAPCFRFTYAMSVTLPFDGVTGLGFQTGANSWGLLINNQKATTHTIAAGDIQISGKTVAGNFTRSTNYATTWGDALQQDVAVSEASISVKGYSVSVVTFTTV